MYEKAVEKITLEMNANEHHPYVQVIGRFLLAHLEQHPEHAERILAEGKTILKSLDAMRRYAETKRVGNVAVISDADGFGIVLQYFECWDGEPFDIPPEPQPPARPTTPPRTATAKSTTTAKHSHAPAVTQLSLFDDAEGGEAL
ncbi:hypothetical protein SAMN04489725_12527 [Alicyclobacillus hesperidum]|uniref:Uncharacterized protein n=1 Tax=Alicyclobacillus hesperidum TaxID=89784 RepID=A0A1H2XY10_9BACL|nr:hypothetical protein [Alicyclobacillus hesperidum]SDW97767.1 hypothetical protein SAMN04489725_12527 [Alicyclobacillus hesperidum]